MTDFIAGEKGVPIRYPSVANLMIDSTDRNYTINQYPWDFQITKNYSIMNGFFTRIATTEVVLEWCYPNIIAGLNDTFDIDISGATGVINNHTITLPYGFYTIETALDEIVSQLNDLSGTTGSTFLVSQVAGGSTYITSLDGGNIEALDFTQFIPNRLFVPNQGMNDAYLVQPCPDFRLIRYLDFTSSQLTYCQDVKDNSTAPNNKDVLCRWYMAWDNQPTNDAYGFPILMGYEMFQLRRLYNPPKQIKWDSNQPIGNLAFQVYDQDGELMSLYDADKESNWLMTLQVSEV